MMILFFIYLNLFSLSPDSNLNLLDQVILSPELFSFYKKEAMDQLPSFYHSLNNIQEHITQNCPNGRFFKTLSSLSPPPLLNEQEKEDIKTHVLSQFQVYENPLKRHVTIVGAGPIGLLTAIELGLYGHQITLIEKRTTYSRDRFFSRFHVAVSHFFEKFSPPHLFHKFNTKFLFIKHFEEWMFTVFKATQQLNPSIQILYGTFTNYTFKNNQLIIFLKQNDKTLSIYSDCLFGCDGANSSVRYRIQNNFGYTKKRSYPDRDTYDSLILAPASFLVGQGKHYLLLLVGQGKHYQLLYRSIISPFSSEGQDHLMNDPLFSKHCIPLSLFAQHNSSFVYYRHSLSYLDSNSQAPVFLLGESLNSYGLGRSFFTNTSQFYNNISLINQHLETQSWRELFFLIQEDQLQPLSYSIALPTCLDRAVTLHTELLYRPQQTSISKKDISLILEGTPESSCPIVLNNDKGLLAIKKFLNKLSSDNRLLFRANETLYTIIHSRVSYGFKCPSVILEFIENEQTEFFQDYIPLITHENLQDMLSSHNSRFFEKNPPTLNQETSNQVTTTYQNIKKRIHLLFPLPRPLCHISYNPLTYSS